MYGAPLTYPISPAPSLLGLLRVGLGRLVLWVCLAVALLNAALLFLPAHDPLAVQACRASTVGGEAVLCLLRRSDIGTQMRTDSRESLSSFQNRLRALQGNTALPEGNALRIR